MWPFNELADVGLKEHFDAVAHSRPARVPLWKSALQSEWICKRAADALVVGASRLQTLPRLEFDLILTVRDRPQVRDTPDVDDVRSMDTQEVIGIEHALNGVHGYM
jgi:hypothetical protein